MCYYARIDYACDDWKWGNMKLRCPRQHRMGETCGAKLVHLESVEKSKEVCKKCADIETKKRRLRKELDNIARWRKEGNKFRASIAKAQEEAELLEDIIRNLHEQRTSVAMKMHGNVGSGPGVSGYNSVPAIGYAETSASRHAPTPHNGYVSAQGYAGGQSRHAPSYVAETTGVQVDRHSPSYTSTSEGRHSVSYHSGYSNGRR